jgi:hypothetical protein
MLLSLRFQLAGRTKARVGAFASCTPHQHRANMSSDAKQQENAKFGHLPLSTSGPQETSLTACLHQA